MLPLGFICWRWSEIIRNLKFKFQKPNHTNNKTLGNIRSGSAQQESGQCPITKTNSPGQGAITDSTQISSNTYNDSGHFLGDIFLQYAGSIVSYYVMFWFCQFLKYFQVQILQYNMINFLFFGILLGWDSTILRDELSVLEYFWAQILHYCVIKCQFLEYFWV